MLEHFKARDRVYAVRGQRQAIGVREEKIRWIPPRIGFDIAAFCLVPLLVQELDIVASSAADIKDDVSGMLPYGCQPLRVNLTPACAIALIVVSLPLAPYRR